MLFPSFKTIKTIPLDEIRATYKELVHLPTGAKVIHIDTEDDENLFSLSFKTLPKNSTGVAHILEHTVLCGSKKFDVKDPFFAMTRRSLSTFMNALTGSDFTCYPAASQVKKDFYNLLDVYLDAVFFPRLRKVSFLQEGHRLEYGEEGSLEIKGVVYNEMKGSMSSEQNRLWHFIMEDLVPDLSYRHHSGGDPAAITDLTYEELVEFHKTYYHPGHCTFFFYGNFPLDEHLLFIEERVLKDAKAPPPLPEEGIQKRFLAMKEKTCFYPSEKDAKGNTYVSLSWLTYPVKNSIDILGLTILDILLMGTDAGPLKKALQQSGLCKQAQSYLDDSMSEVPYVITAKGCDPKSKEAIQKLIFKTLEEVAKVGFSQADIEASLHQLEFSRLEIGGDGSPYGLTLFMRAVLPSQHGVPAEEGLCIHTLFHHLREKLSNPNYLKDLIRSLLSNTHATLVEMQPDPHMQARLDEEEKQKIKVLEKTLTDEQKQKIIEEANALHAFQEKSETQDLSCLPKLSLKEVPKVCKDYPLKTEKQAMPVHTHECFTNRILYADWVFWLPEVEEKNLCLLKLFSTLIGQVGCKEASYEKTLDRTLAYTGGVGASCTLFTNAQNPHEAKPALSLHGKALERHIPQFFNLLSDLTESSFSDTNRLKEIIAKQLTALESSLASASLSYAMAAAQSGFSSPLYVQSKWHGLDYLRFLRDAHQNFEALKDQLIHDLERMRDHIFNEERAELIMTSNALPKDPILRIQNPSANAAPFKAPTLKTKASKAFTISSPVSFIAESIPTSAYIDPISAPLSLAAEIMDNTYLHPKIREQGGAYGGGAKVNLLSGTFNFYSYRDPHIQSSLDAFYEAIQKVSKGDFSIADVEEAKLGMLQKLDHPVSFGMRGSTAFSWLQENRPHAVREAFRNALLKASIDEITQSMEILQKNYEKRSTAIFSSQQNLTKENITITSESA